MGREIRMVPPNWEHPREMKYIERREFTGGQWVDDPEGDYIPLHEDFDADLHKFLADAAKDGWRKALADHDGGPNPDDYVDYKDQPATWFQVYETVTWGTPVTPPFPTKEELINYLVEHGDFWDQERRKEGSDFPCAPWSREAAERFVHAGFAPTMAVDGGKITSINGRSA